MTTEELMLLADAYADAEATYHLNPNDETEHASALARAALEEALSLTSSFGGL